MLRSNYGLKCLKTPFGLTTKVNQNGKWDVDVVKKGEQVCRYKTDSYMDTDNSNVLTYYDDNDEKYGPDTSFFFVKVGNSDGKYSLVRFDKNGGDSEAWVNDEIVEKGKSFSESKGVLPQEEPKKAGHQFAGWAYSSSDKAPTFNKDQKINNSMTLYAVYIKDQEYPLNESGNVYAKPAVDATGKTIIEIKTKKSGEDDDVQIDRAKWNAMAVEFGAKNISDLSWAEAGGKKSIKFVSNVEAPSDMSRMFYAFGGDITGLDKLNTKVTTDFSYAFSNVNGKVDGSDFKNWNTGAALKFTGMFKSSSINPGAGEWNTQKVEDMREMFADAASANPDVTKWNVKSVKKIDSIFNGAEKANPDIRKWAFTGLESMREAFTGSNIEKADLSKWEFSSVGLASAEDAFTSCENIKYLKTSPGLATTIGGPSGDFKVVRLEKGSPAQTEEESKDISNDYKVNSGGRQDVAYNVYQKDSYAGVTFDINGGDRESFRNHEIVKIGKSIRASEGTLPEQEPQKNASRFKGWSKTKDAEASDFTVNEAVTEDTTVYAVYEKRVPAKVRFHATGGSLGDVPPELEGLTGNILGSSFPTEQPTRKGYDFVGWSLKASDANTGAITPGSEFTKDTPIPDAETEVYAVWKERQKITIRFNANGGNLGSLSESKEIYEREALGDEFPPHHPTNVANMDPKREGYTFIGWGYNKHSRVPEATKDTVFTKSQTLYAIWKEGKIGRAHV